MPPTLALVHRLREADVPAVVSGAGPSVLAFTGHHTRDDVRGRVPAGWQALALEIDQRGAVVEVDA
jgi:homoserine kinase